MNDNVSVEISSHSYFEKLGQQSLYVATGLSAIVTNAILMWAIGTNKRLHKKAFYCAFGLAVADALNGAGYLLAGIRRFALIVRGGDLVPSYNLWDCYLTAPMPFLIVGPQAVALMTTALCVDRLLAAVCAKKYRILNHRTYVRGFIGGVCALTLISWLACGYLSYVSNRSPSINALCVSGYAESYRVAKYAMEACLGVVNCAIMIVTFVCTASRLSASSSDPDFSKVYLKRQRMVAQIVGAVVACTMLFWIAPSTAVFALTLLGDRSYYLNTATYMWIVNSASSTISPLIYMFKSEPIKSTLFKTTAKQRRRRKVGPANQQYRIYEL